MLLMKNVQDFNTNDRLNFIAKIRSNPELAAAVASMVLELAEFHERELTNEKGRANVPALISFKRLRVFRAFFVYQAERAKNTINKHFKIS